jgi:hypothetical protein
MVEYIFQICIIFCNAVFWKLHLQNAIHENFLYRNVPWSVRENTSAGACRASGNGGVTVKSHHLTITPHFEVFNRSVNNYEVNTKSMFDGQVLVILVSHYLWGQNTSTRLPRRKIFFEESRACLMQGAYLYRRLSGKDWID